MADKTSHQELSLKALCQAKSYTGVVFDFHYVHGVITAVAACPEIPMPELWMPWVLKPRSQRLSNDQKDAIAHALMTMLQTQLKRMTDRASLLPDESAFKERELNKISGQTPTDHPLSLWCSGVLTGHAQLESVWANAWDKMMSQVPDELLSRQKQLKHVLSMLSTFANIPLAVEQAQNKGNNQLEAHLPTIARSLPNTIKEYVDLSGSLVSYLENQFETFVKPQNTKR